MTEFSEKRMSFAGFEVPSPNSCLKKMQLLNTRHDDVQVHILPADLTTQRRRGT